MPLPPKELSTIFNSTNEQATGIVNVEELAEDSDHAHEVQEQTGTYKSSNLAVEFYPLSYLGNIFKTYGTALYSAASMANSRIFKIVLG